MKRGDIETAGDEDWFKVTLEAGKTYVIELLGLSLGHGTLADPFLRGVYDSDGVLQPDTQIDDGGWGTNSRVKFAPTVDGVYYVAAGADGSGTGTYRLSVVRDDFADDTDTAGTVAVGGSATGDIEYTGDVDWFKVTLQADNIYRIDLEGFDTGDGTLEDPLLRGIYDSSGTLIDMTDDNDTGEEKNSRVYFRATEDATYYVAAASFKEVVTGTYTLSVTEIDDDFAADTETAGTVDVGG